MEADCVWHSAGAGRIRRDFKEGVSRSGFPKLLLRRPFLCFYDQELYLENVPAKAVMLRTIEFIYKFNDQLDEILPRRALFERYGMLEHMGLYQKFISHF